MSTANRVIKNTGWLYAKMAITMFVSLYTTRIILQTLGADDFGIYNIVGGAISLLCFVNSSMAGATQRFMSYATGQGHADRLRTIFNVSYVIHIFLASLAVIIFCVAGFFFFNGILNIPDGRTEAAVAVYVCLIVSTFFTMISVPYEAVMNAHENMKYYAVVGIFESLLKLLVACAVVYSPIDKLIYYGALMSSIPLVVLSIMRIYCHTHYKECKISFLKYWSKSLAKEMMTFAGWGLTNTTATMFTMQGMSILLNMFGGVVVNAAHGVANQLSGQLMVFSNNMLKALSPVLVKSRGAGENEKMLEAASTGNKLSFLLFSLFALPFIFETPVILRLWLKTPPEWTVLFVRLVLIRQMVSQVMVTLDTCIQATGRIKNFTMVNSIIWISPLVVGYFMYKAQAPIYTIYILLIVMNFLRMANALFFCHELCNLNIGTYFMRTILPCVWQSLMLIGILLTVCYGIEESICRMILVFCLTILLHPMLAFYICLNSKERSFLSTIKQKIFCK